MPALAVVVIGALVAGVVVWLGRRPKPERRPAAAGGPTGGVSVERARHASSLLSEDAHRSVYGRIATNRPMEAVTEYRRVTGRSLRDSMVDVQSLAAYPQVYTLPQEDPQQDGSEQRPDPAVGEGPEAAESPVGRRADRGPVRPGAAGDETGRAEDEAPVGAETAPGGGPDTAESAADEDASATEHGESVTGRDGAPARTGGEPSEDGNRPSSDAGAVTRGQDGPEHPEAPALPELPADLMVPAEWSAEPAPEDQPFEVEVMRGDGTVHLSSRDLPPWLRDQLSAMMRDGNLETAAVQLSTHTELSVPEAFELLRRIQESRGQ